MEEQVQMNTRKSLYDVKSFYNKKAILKASYQGMRYQVQQIEEEEEKKLKVSVWPEPFCYEKTAEDKIIVQTFEYSEDGLDKAYEYLVNIYAEKKDVWEHVRDFPMEGVIG